MGPYRDRRAAGEALAGALDDLRGGDALLLALPRGGVPVAAVVAARLGLPLDICLVCKVGTPGQEELALGAVAEGGVCLLNAELAGRLGLDDAEVSRAVAGAERRLGELGPRLRGDRSALALQGRTAVLVDDGLATGASMRAAVASARRRGARRIVVAAPVAAPDTVDHLAGEVDLVVCPYRPRPLGAVGSAYEDFSQVDDAEVVALLAAARA